MYSSTSRSLIKRIVPLFASGIKHNHRLLTTTISPSPLSSSVHVSHSPSHDSLLITDTCVQKMKALQAEEGKEKLLRLSIEAGGCSGFQYNFSLEDKENNDDRVFEKNGVKVVIDKISFDFVKGATVDYVEELIRSAFQVTTNPSAVGGCSCKSSFMVK